MTGVPLLQSAPSKYVSLRESDEYRTTSQYSIDTSLQPQVLRTNQPTRSPSQDHLDTVIIDRFEKAFSVLQHLQERLLLARALSKRLERVFVILMRFRSEYQRGPDLRTDEVDTKGLKAYIEDVELWHKKVGDEEPDNEDAPCAKVPDLRLLLPSRSLTNITAEDRASPRVVKNETKGKHGSSAHGSTVGGTPESVSMTLTC